jgi:aminoglycoside/choline kinase family phosphotransferase
MAVFFTPVDLNVYCNTIGHPMADREQQIMEFLGRAGWAGASVQSMAGDLSARNYERLTQPDGSRAILMDANPDLDPSTPAFLAMTDWLSARGLSVPKVFAAQKNQGLLLLEDFGDEKLTGLIQRNPKLSRDYYHLAIEALIVIRNATPAALERPSAAQMAEATMVADQWYPGANRSALEQLRGVLEAALADVLATKPTVSLRDFHTDNVIWLEDREGVRKVGILDYQDALLTQPAYDLMSLLTDARVTVPRALRAEMIGHYARQTNDAVEDVTLAVAVLGAQRNLRILGIFARAARQYGKTQHLNSVPRVYEYLSECLLHPQFSGRCPRLQIMLPVPTAELIAGLRK